MSCLLSQSNSPRCLLVCDSHPEPFLTPCSMPMLRVIEHAWLVTRKSLIFEGSIMVFVNLFQSLAKLPIAHPINSGRTLDNKMYDGGQNACFQRMSMFASQSAEMLLQAVFMGQYKLQTSFWQPAAGSLLIRDSMVFQRQCFVSVCNVLGKHPLGNLKLCTGC